MKYKIKYVGGLGEINFSKSPIFYEENVFFEYEWNIDSSQLPYGNGSIVNAITSSGIEKTLVVNIVKKDKASILNNLEDIANYDVINKQIGRLYINDQYVECYISGIESNGFKDNSLKESLSIKFFIQNPKWITEKTYNFSRFDDRELSDGFEFPFSFPFSFSKTKPSSKVVNDSVVDTKGIIKIFGPCVNPYFYVNNNKYQMNLELLDNERVEINQITGKINKVTALGTYIDMFNYRESDDNCDVFALFPSGTFEIVYSGNFSLSLTLLIERNIPKWI